MSVTTITQQTQAQQPEQIPSPFSKFLTSAILTLKKVQNPLSWAYTNLSIIPDNISNKFFAPRYSTSQITLYKFNQKNFQFEKMPLKNGSETTQNSPKIPDLVLLNLPFCHSCSTLL